MNSTTIKFLECKKIKLSNLPHLNLLILFFLILVSTATQNQSTSKRNMISNLPIVEVTDFNTVFNSLFQIDFSNTLNKFGSTNSFFANDRIIFGFIQNEKLGIYISDYNFSTTTSALVPDFDIYDSFSINELNKFNFRSNGLFGYTLNSNLVFFKILAVSPITPEFYLVEVNYYNWDFTYNSPTYQSQNFVNESVIYDMSIDYRLEVVVDIGYINLSSINLLLIGIKQR